MRGEGKPLCEGEEVKKRTGIHVVGKYKEELFEKRKEIRNNVQGYGRRQWRRIGEKHRNYNVQCNY